MKFKEFLRWLTVLPFWYAISPVFFVSMVLAFLGLLSFFLGLVNGDAPAVIFGLMALVPFLFVLFLLWRTYIDDGYQL